MDFLNRTWAEIDLDRLHNNLGQIRNRVGKDTKIMCVVKADAYGHGAVHIANALKDKADYFAVSNIEEAVELRRAGIALPILILGVTPVVFAKELAQYNITQTLLSYDYAMQLAQSAQQQKVAVTCHIKVDTGMNRLGFECDDTRLYDVCQTEGLKVEGIFTHFASSDKDGDTDGAFTKAQFDTFMQTVQRVEKQGFSFAIKHCCNSAATIANPEYHLDMVRAGIILYGLQPSGAIAIDGFTPVMSLKSNIAMIKTVSPGESVSYGRTFTATKPTEVATLPIGYADGYLRAFAKGANVLSGGKQMPVIGRICMDQCMIDVTDQKMHVGDTVTLFGYEGDTLLPIEQLAALADTINYELICVLSKRVGRVYLKDGNVVDQCGLLDH